MSCLRVTILAAHLRCRSYRLWFAFVFKMQSLPPKILIEIFTVCSAIIYEICDCNVAVTFVLVPPWKTPATGTEDFH